MRFEPGRRSLAPYRNYRCSDGQWVFIAGGNDRLWARIAGAIGLESLIDDPKFASNPERVKNRDELDAIVQQAVGSFDRCALLKLLESRGVPATPVNTVDEVLKDPQVEALDMVWHMPHPRKGDLPVVAFPLAFSRSATALRRNAPRHGEHTDEVLKEYGYSPREIGELREKKAIR